MSHHVSLKSMAEDKSLEGVGKVTHFRVDPRLIRVEQGFNVRFETPARRAYIDGLKAAKRAGATFPPLDVRVEDGVVIVVDGHNRLQMDMELIAEGEDIQFVECRHFRGNDAERVAHMASTGQQGLPLSPLESGHSYRRLVNYGWPVVRIAAFVGRSDTHVEQCILLAEADTEIQQMIVRNEVPAHIVVEVIRKHGGGSKALEILLESLVRAQAAGGRKVTAKTLHGPTIPRDVVGKVVSSLDTFYTRLSAGDRQNLETLLQGNEAELEGRTVTLSAVSLKALFDAHQEIQQVKARAEKRGKKASANAPEPAAASADADSHTDDEFNVEDVVTHHLSRAA